MLIPRIFKEAADYGLREPELKYLGISFRINLFRKPFETDPLGVVHPWKNDAEHQRSASYDAEHDAQKTGLASFDTQKEMIDSLLVSLPEKSRERAGRILDCMIRNRHSTAVQNGKEIGLSKATVQRAIEVMKTAGIVSRQGSNNGGIWVIILQPHSISQTKMSLIQMLICPTGWWEN